MDLYEKLTEKKENVLLLSQLFWLQNLNHSDDFIHIWTKKKTTFPSTDIIHFGSVYMRWRNTFWNTKCLDNIGNQQKSKAFMPLICIFISIVLKETDFSRFRSLFVRTWLTWIFCWWRKQQKHLYRTISSTINNDKAQSQPNIEYAKFLFASAFFHFPSSIFATWNTKRT